MAQQYEQLRLENQLCFPLYACARKIVASYTPFLKPLGLTYTQYIVLMALWEKEKLSVGELGSMLRLDAGTLSPLLKGFEKKGYVTRSRSKEDERVTEICITAEGNALKEKCKDIPGKVSSVVRVLEPDEAGELYDLLYKMIG